MFPLALIHLRALGVPSLSATAFIVPLLQACSRFEINTIKRIGAFLGQCMVESNGFRTMEEDLNYRTAARIVEIFRISEAKAAVLANKPEAMANFVYAGKNGNGDEASGDGWRYHGRGLIQTTGRRNYGLAEKGVNKPYLARPDLLATPEDACLSSAFYWTSNGLNALADAGQIDAITRAVNGRRMLEADVRLALTTKAVGYLTNIST